MCSSLEEAFEFCWSLFAEHKPIIKQEKHKIKQTYINFGPHYNQIYNLNIDLHHKFGISVGSSEE